MFLSKQVHEVIVMRKNEYRYIAECIFIKDGKKQIWRYTSFLNEDNKIERQLKKLV